MNERVTAEDRFSSKPEIFTRFLRNASYQRMKPSKWVHDDAYEGLE
ncbi:hypothetical protein J2Y66_003770 [Paenarthrobacter nitroguajacolicus]|nr:hypothetical protein [Paenarthrobacter nitroguajacolicus]